MYPQGVLVFRGQCQVPYNLKCCANIECESRQGIRKTLQRSKREGVSGVRLILSYNSRHDTSSIMTTASAPSMVLA